MIPESASAFSDHLIWANKRYDAVIRWLDADRAEREGDGFDHPSCGLYCSALMMMGARNNPRLKEILPLAGKASKIWPTTAARGRGSARGRRAAKGRGAAKGRRANRASSLRTLGQTV
jgi:hypothetical protein